jgi:hypothetical protein
MVGMKTATRHKGSEAEIWLRILFPNGKLTRTAARTILELSMPPDKLARSRELLVKARAGTQSPDEDLEMEEFERAGAILSTIKSKARQVLKKTTRI